MFSKQANASVADKEKKSLKKALRRAFTITELVIVIAVIAILAAVLIPTFTSLINRANQSADTQTVKNLNTILASEEAFGNRAETIDEALAQALEGGYKVENLTPTGEGYDIVWDQTNNRFALVDASGKKIYGDASTPDNISGQEYWKITDDASKATDNAFSWYLTEDALSSDGGTVESYTITSATSLNLSAFTDLKTVTISDQASGEINLTTNSEDVEIVTKATSAENAPTINLYGTAGTISGGKSDYGILSGAYLGMNSLHVYGNVEAIYPFSGRIVIESGAEVNYIVFVSNVNSYKDDIDLTIKDGGKLNYLGTSLSFGLSGLTSILPESAAASTKIISDREICKDPTYIAGGIGEKDAPYLISTAAQLQYARTGFFDATGLDTIYFKLVNDLTMGFQYTTSFSNMVLDLAGHTITNKVAQKDTGDPSTSLFSAFKVISATNLTIEDSVGGGGIITPDAYLSTDVGAVDYVFDVIGQDSSCSLTINGGTFSGVISVAQVGYSSSITVNGGTFSTLNPDEQSNNYYVLNKDDDSDATITINGGRFKNFNPADTKTDPTSDGSKVSYLGDGCKSEQDTSIAGETWWVVTK